MIVRRSLVVIFLFGICLITLLILLNKTELDTTEDYKASRKFLKVPSPDVQFNFSSIFETQACITDEELSTSTIDTLKNLIQKLNRSKDVSCLAGSLALPKLYDITWREAGQIYIDSSVFKAKVLEWLGGNQLVYDNMFNNQIIVSICNKYTLDETKYNPLRNKRPHRPQGNDEFKYIQELINQTDGAEKCDFCDYKRMTARDGDGRLETSIAYTADNSFKAEAKNQMIVMKKHHPLNWSEVDLVGTFKLAQKWMEKEHIRNKSYKYPVIAWDLFPPAGSSQVHPHIHILLTPDRYPGVAEKWRRAAHLYYKTHKSNYYKDLIQVHHSLGLTAQYKTAVALASLTPIKDNEMLVMADEFSLDFFQLLYRVIRYLLDERKRYSFSLFVYIPPLVGIREDDDSDMPVVARIVSRQSLINNKSDFSSFELFAAPAIPSICHSDMVGGTRCYFQGP